MSRDADETAVGDSPSGAGDQPRGARDRAHGVTQVSVAAAIGVTQAYVSDVARQRHRTITVANARKFAHFFGCRIEDLFPSPE